MIVGIPLFVEIPQQISCGISTIMGRAAGPPGRPDNPDGTGAREPGAKAGSAYVAALRRAGARPEGAQWLMNR